MNYEETIASIKSHLGDNLNIDYGIICGTGLGPIADEIEEPVTLSYSEIPGYPTSSVKGHAGRLVYGTLQGKKVLAFQGRFHYYEGYAIDQVVSPVRTLQLLGARRLIVTNAAGGLNRQFKVGDLMVIEDHINFMFQNPLIGPNDENLGLRFPDMSQPYSREAGDQLIRLAREQGIPIQRGVYMGVTGPSYETRAELRAFGRMADAVGMSTVPEVITAVHGGFETIVGISVITNMATGEDVHEESHGAVVEAANKATPNMVQLVRSYLKSQS